MLPREYANLTYEYCICIYHMYMYIRTYVICVSKYGSRKLIQRLNIINIIGILDAKY